MYKYVCCKHYPVSCCFYCAQNSWTLCSASAWCWPDFSDVIWPKNLSPLNVRVCIQKCNAANGVDALHSEEIVLLLSCCQMVIAPHKHLRFNTLFNLIYKVIFPMCGKGLILNLMIFSGRIIKNSGQVR